MNGYDHTEYFRMVGYTSHRRLLLQGWPGRSAKNTKQTKGGSKSDDKLGIRPAYIPLFRS